MTIQANLTTLISSTTVASAAGFSQADWSGYHVFVGSRDMVRGMNRGRAPYVVLWRNSSDYVADSVGSTSTDAGGTLSTQWQLRVVSVEHDESLAENEIRKIANACFYAIRTDSKYRPGAEGIGFVQSYPWGSFADCTFTLENTYSQGGRI